MSDDEPVEAALESSFRHDPFPEFPELQEVFGRILLSMCNSKVPGTSWTVDSPLVSSDASSSPVNSSTSGGILPIYAFSICSSSC